MLTVFNDSIKTQSVSRLVVEKIKEAISKGELKPGDALPSESELVKNLGVSKSSVREAIKMLEAIGVVDINRGLGTVLSENPYKGYANVLLFQLAMQLGSVEEFMQFRKCFEIAYTKMAMENSTEEDLINIRKTIETYEGNIKNGVLNIEDDLSFHKSVLEATHNKFIISLGDAINSMFASSIEYSIKNRPMTAVDNHKDIFAAIIEKDISKLEKSIEESVLLWSDSLK